MDSHTHPSILRIHIKQSKTDPFRQGIHNIFLGRMEDPVSVTLAYLPARGLTPGPLFCFENGRPLTRARLVEHLRSSLSAAGIQSDESRYSGHSFRIGAATTATAMGIEDSLIKTLGQWESSAYQRYIQTPCNRLVEVSLMLSRAT